MLSAKVNTPPSTAEGSLPPEGQAKGQEAVTPPAVDQGVDGRKQNRTNSERLKGLSVRTVPCTEDTDVV